MKAFVVSRYGKKNGVESVERREPELRDDDVLVQIHAASVNPLDLKIRNGELKAILPYKLPLVLGNDLAGVVIKVDQMFSGSGLVTRSTRSPTKIGSALSRK
jgi:NADPH:quinone reductase-like Zn-dependent oxidoreductase